MVKVGDRVVVGSWSNFPTYVESIVEEPGLVTINLQWPDNQKSRVYLHDQGKTWDTYSNYLARN